MSEAYVAMYVDNTVVFHHFSFNLILTLLSCFSGCHKPKENITYQAGKKLCLVCWSRSKKKEEKERKRESMCRLLMSVLEQVQLNVHTMLTTGIKTRFLFDKF